MAELTQIQKVRNHLNIFKSITTWEAYEKYNITRVSAVIFQLKSEMKIDDYVVQKGKKSFKRYFVKGYEKPKDNEEQSN